MTNVVARVLLVLCFLFVFSSFAEAGVFKRIQQRRQARIGTGCPTGNCGQTFTGTTASGCGAGGCRTGR